MTPKQQRFVEEYLIDLIATQAALRAGYSAKTACSQGQRLLTNVEVAEAIAQNIEERTEKAGIDALWVLQEAKSVYEAARQLDKLPDALRALEIVGKHIDVQAFQDKVQHGVRMSPDEAHKIIATLLPKFAQDFASDATTISD